MLVACVAIRLFRIIFQKYGANIDGKLMGMFKPPKSKKYVFFLWNPVDDTIAQCNEQGTRILTSWKKITPQQFVKKYWHGKKVSALGRIIMNGRHISKFKPLLKNEPLPFVVTNDDIRGPARPPNSGADASGAAVPLRGGQAARTSRSPIGKAARAPLGGKRIARGAGGAGPSVTPAGPPASSRAPSSGAAGGPVGSRGMPVRARLADSTARANAGRSARGSGDAGGAGGLGGARGAGGGAGGLGGEGGSARGLGGEGAVPARGRGRPAARGRSLVDTTGRVVIRAPPPSLADRVARASRFYASKPPTASDVARGKVGLPRGADLYENTIFRLPGEVACPAHPPRAPITWAFGTGGGAGGLGASGAGASGGAGGLGAGASGGAGGLGGAGGRAGGRSFCMDSESDFEQLLVECEFEGTLRGQTGSSARVFLLSLLTADGQPKLTQARQMRVLAELNKCRADLSDPALAGIRAIMQPMADEEEQFVLGGPLNPTPGPRMQTFSVSSRRIPDFRKLSPMPAEVTKKPSIQLQRLRNTARELQGKWELVAEQLDDMEDQERMLEFEESVRQREIERKREQAEEAAGAAREAERLRIVHEYGRARRIAAEAAQAMAFQASRAVLDNVVFGGPAQVTEADQKLARDLLGGVAFGVHVRAADEVAQALEAEKERDQAQDNQANIDALARQELLDAQAERAEVAQALEAEKERDQAQDNQANIDALARQELLDAQAERAEVEHRDFQRQVVARMNAGSGEGGAGSRVESVAQEALAVLYKQDSAGKLETLVNETRRHAQLARTVEFYMVQDGKIDPSLKVIKVGDS